MMEAPLLTFTILWAVQPSPALKRGQYQNSNLPFLITIAGSDQDRKSTRLNSSHLVISYAVFCLKKKHNHVDVLVRLRLEHVSELVFRGPVQSIPAVMPAGRKLCCPSSHRFLSLRRRAALEDWKP